MVGAIERNRCFMDTDVRVKGLQYGVMNDVLLLSSLLARVKK